MEPNFTTVLDGKIEIRTYPQGIAVLAFGVGQAFEINETGYNILQRIKQPINVNKLVSELVAEFGTPLNTVMKDTHKFLKDCSEFGIIQLYSDSTEP